VGINFHSEKNRMTYANRLADTTWKQAIEELIPVRVVSKALDIGCGGGTYSKALVDMGIKSVTGVDFSKAILDGARQNCKKYKNISFVYGNALDTNLESDSYDFLLERALIHHIQDLHSCVLEAFRLLKENGVFIVQDRTSEDCLLKGDENHIRGFLFELFPMLTEKEINRRHKSHLVIETLRAAGFKDIEEVKLWETRAIYNNKEELLTDLSQRTGRSILHELDDKELKLLLNHIDQSLSNETRIVEKDRWTIWKAVK